MKVSSHIALKNSKKLFTIKFSLKVEVEKLENLFAFFWWYKILNQFGCFKRLSSVNDYNYYLCYC